RRPLFIEDLRWNRTFARRDSRPQASAGQYVFGALLALVRRGRLHIRRREAPVSSVIGRVEIVRLDTGLEPPFAEIALKPAGNSDPGRRAYELLCDVPR